MKQKLPPELQKRLAKAKKRLNREEDKPRTWKCPMCGHKNDAEGFDNCHCEEEMRFGGY